MTATESRDPPTDKCRLRVYIDIDGTILFTPGDASASTELDHQLVCEGLEEFLAYVVEHCDPYWLSYRTRLGRCDSLVERLYPHVPAVARAIPAANWDGFKHEAIDPRSHFVWFEDDIEDEDLSWLEKHGRLDCFVRIGATHRANPSLMLAEVKSRIDVSSLMNRPRGGTP